MAEELWANLTVRFVSLYEKGRYQAALNIAERAYVIAIDNFGLNDVNTADTLRDLCLSIIIGGVIYLPLCLYEIRMSPQLHSIFYGFLQ